MAQWFALPAMVAAIFGLAFATSLLRKRAMRALAVRRGFRYCGSNLPNSFHMRDSGGAGIKRAFNVIEGEKDGLAVLVCDAVMGTGKGAYCTFVAARTDNNPFGMIGNKEKLRQSKDWMAVSRMRLLQVPGQISIKRIEELLDSITPQKG